MSIKKDVVFPNSNTPKHKQVVFDTINEFRLVKPSTTAIIISQIMDMSDESLSYKFDAKYLIPENTNPEHDIPKYSEANVRAAYKLLKPKTNLNFIEALFLLLGLDPYQSTLPPFNDFKNENYDPFNDCLSLESIFYVTKQYQALKRSSSLVNGKIKSEDLIELAKDSDNNFFQDKGLIYFLKQKKKTNNIETNKRNTKIYKLWGELSPKLKITYPTKVSIYRDIIIKLNLDIGEEAVKKIITQKAKKN